MELVEMGHTGLTDNNRSVHLLCLYLFEYKDDFQMNTNIRIIRIIRIMDIRMRTLSRTQIGRQPQYFGEWKRTLALPTCPSRSQLVSSRGRRRLSGLQKGSGSPGWGLWIHRGGLIHWMREAKFKINSLVIFFYILATSIILYFWDRKTFLLC